MKLILSIFLIVFSLTISFSCRKDKAPNSVLMPLVCADTVSYFTKIGPLIQQNCATSGCHDAVNSSAGYNLTTHTSISANAEIILKTMKHDPQVASMPFGSDKLADSIIQQFECWMNQGKLNN